MLFYFLNLFICLYIATPVAYGSSWARSQIEDAALGLCHSHGNTRSLTHWVRPGIKPASSQIKYYFLSPRTLEETHKSTILIFYVLSFFYDLIGTKKGEHRYPTASGFLFLLGSLTVFALWGWPNFIWSYTVIVITSFVLISLFAVKSALIWFMLFCCCYFWSKTRYWYWD